MVYAQQRNRPEDWDAHTSLGFWDANKSLNLGQTTRPSDNQKKKKNRTCRIYAFAVPAKHWVKSNEIEKRDSFLNLPREQKKTNYVT